MIARFDRKLAELAEAWSAAPEEIQEMIYTLVANLVSATHATVELARVKDPRPFLASALGHYADRKEDPKAHPIRKKKR